MLLVHRPLLVAFLAVEMVCRNASVKPKAKAKWRANGTAQAKSNAAKALTQERKVATRGSALQHVLLERALERLVKRCRDQPLLVSLINEAIDSGALTCATPKHSCRVVFSHSVTYNFQTPKKYIRQLIDEMEARTAECQRRRGLELLGEVLHEFGFLVQHVRVYFWCTYAALHLCQRRSRLDRAPQVDRSSTRQPFLHIEVPAAEQAHRIRQVVWRLHIAPSLG